ncbi:PadR family transcriptional regulator [Paenibacillus ginsengihumi]|uniref:PadR family transcriptional regulator n=1 Tax=Paenibacillus ginsengihumi TaxID=431596 RepID=UPI003CCBBAC4
MITLSKLHNHRAWRGNHPERKWFDKEDMDREDMHRELLRRYRHGWPRGGGFGGRGEGRRFFERGRFKFALLELLAAEPMHGYQLIKAMEEKTGGLYSPSPGSVYPNLQLLEDLQLIGSSEADGKKLYHITEAGRAYLREQGRSDMERPERRWAYDGRQRPRGGEYSKRHLRGLMKEWSEVIYMMAAAAEAAKADPSSRQARQFQELMDHLQDRLKELLPSAPDFGQVGSAKPASEGDSSEDDSLLDGKRGGE